MFRGGYLYHCMNHLLSVRKGGNFNSIRIPEQPQTSDVPNGLSVNCSIKREPICDLFSSRATYMGFHNGWAVSLIKLSYIALKIGLQRSPIVPNDDIHNEIKKRGGTLINLR